MVNGEGGLLTLGHTREEGGGSTAWAVAVENSKHDHALGETSRGFRLANDFLGEVAGQEWMTF